MKVDFQQSTDGNVERIAIDDSQLKPGAGPNSFECFRSIISEVKVVDMPVGVKLAMNASPDADIAINEIEIEIGHSLHVTGSLAQVDHNWNKVVSYKVYMRLMVVALNQRIPNEFLLLNAELEDYEGVLCIDFAIHRPAWDGTFGQFYYEVQQFFQDAQNEVDLPCTCVFFKRGRTC